MDIDKIKRDQDARGYLNIKAASASIDAMCNAWDMPKYILKDIKTKSYHSLPRISRDWFDGFDNYGITRDIYDYVDGMMRQIRMVRNDMGSRNEYNPIIRHEGATVVRARSILTHTFKRTRGIDVKIEKCNLEATIEHEKASEYSVTNTLYLKIGWNKLVHDRGHALVAAGDGRRFVMQSTPVTSIDGLPETASVFKVKTVRFVKQVPKIEMGWLIVHNQDNTPLIDIDDKVVKVHAYNKNLSAAISLLNRRTKAFVLGELIDQL